jgi:hypothetical protein
MEITCNRCHQTVLEENCYCPACGLPQLVFPADSAPGDAHPERWSEAVQDASVVEWKPALRAALILAVPAGMLSSGVSPLNFFGVVWMATSAAWAVTLYVRSQRPAWITTGAGVRIGLVTGILASWLAFGISGGALFVERYLLHRAAQIDADWNTVLDSLRQASQQGTAGMAPADAAQVQAIYSQFLAFLAKPEGHAGFLAFGLAVNGLFLLLFAAAGGALGARWMAHYRRPEI